jgi:TonB family protein
MCCRIRASHPCTRVIAGLYVLLATFLIGFFAVKALSWRDGSTLTGSGKAAPETTTQVQQQSESGSEILLTRAPLFIKAKPRAQYTDLAREQNIQGTVILRVTFSKDSSIGNIQVVQGLGYGLTEQAIAAAKQIVFQPKQINGIPVSVTKIVEYNFSIY